MKLFGVFAIVLLVCGCCDPEAIERTISPIKQEAEAAVSATAREFFGREYADNKILCYGHVERMVCHASFKGTVHRFIYYPNKVPSTRIRYDGPLNEG